MGVWPMNYGELFQLQPIQSVIQLNQADNRDAALVLVERFVVTQSLADGLTRVALPQFVKPAGVEGKGLFVVGNYGTGKSHLMSFLSTVAEHASAIDHLREPGTWRGPLEPVAGRYLVQRTQINGSTMSLYEITATELARLAASAGVTFKFLPQTEVVNAKTEYERFLTALAPVLAGRGVLFVVDELLHYLDSRNDQQLVIDLQTLQGLGEFCHGRPFVFMAGLQRSLFQNKRFQHVADEINKVRQRFYDLLIDSKGVEQLVETYVFAKTDAQKAEIRKRLQSHADLYEAVGTDLERFVALFPAHPLFLDEFQRINVVERREILTVLSNEGRQIAATEVRPERLQLITADRYWGHIEADVGLDSNNGIAKVKGNVRSLRAKIADAPLPSEDKDLAERLVATLAIHRLTTPSIDDAVGLSPQELKNRVLPPARGLMRDRVVLDQGVKRLLEKVREAAAGQFLTTTTDGVQYYIDPRRTTDYDEEVRVAARSISPSVWQRYFNEFLLRQLEIEHATAAQQGRLWQWALPWKEKNVDRPGWLFFDFPSHRSTAKPPYDFYLFLLPSNRISGLSDDEFPDSRDELYVQFEGFPAARCQGEDESAPETFLDHLRLYAAAKERQRELHGSADGKAATERIASHFLALCSGAWQPNSGEWVHVRHRGTTKSLRQWVLDLAPGKAGAEFRERLRSVAANLMASSFDEDYPGYPAFPEPVNEQSRSSAARDATKFICDQGVSGGTAQARSVLLALDLYRDGAWTIDTSPWLNALRGRLDRLTPGQNINASQLFEKRRGREFAQDSVLEAEWFMTVLAAAVRAGEAVAVGEGGATVDAGSLQGGSDLLCDVAKLVRITKPQDFPREPWRKLFRLLGVNEGLLAHDSTLEEAAVQWHAAASKRVNDLVELRQRLVNRLPLADPSRAPSVDLTPLDAAKATLEGLQVYNSRGKMLNLKLRGDSEIAALGVDLRQCAHLQSVGDFVRDHGQRLGALERFRALLREQDMHFTDLCDKATVAMNAAYAHAITAGECDVAALRGSVDQACARGCGAYRSLHKRRRLTKSEDAKKATLVASPAVRALQKLASIAVLSPASLEKQLQELGGLRLFKDYNDDQLLASPTSQPPNDPFDPQKEPVDSASEVMGRCENALATLLVTWTTRLLNDLSDPSVSRAVAALTEAERKPIEAFQRSKQLPDPVPDELVKTLNLLFNGLELLTVNIEEFVAAVLDADQPLSPDELRARFETWMATHIGPRTPASVRIAPEFTGGVPEANHE
jgi:hypothetical protein